MGTAVELLAREMREAYAMLSARLEGLTEAEWNWSPVPDPWTVYRGDDGRWTYHYEEPDAIPAPFTTIGWRVNHLAQCKVMYHEYAFGPGDLTWHTIETAGTIDGTVAMLARGQDLLMEAVGGLADADLESPRMTNWGEEKPCWWILWTMINHDLWHGAEIGALRDVSGRI